MVLVTANYDDLRLEAMGDDVNNVLIGLVWENSSRVTTKLQERADSKKGTAPPSEQAFLKQIIVVTQPIAWQEDGATLS